MTSGKTPTSVLPEDRISFFCDTLGQGDTNSRVDVFLEGTLLKMKPDRKTQTGAHIQSHKINVSSGRTIVGVLLEDTLFWESPETQEIHSVSFRRDAVNFA